MCQTSPLTVDFNKYDETIAVGCRNGNILIYDQRNMKMPLKFLSGHRYGVGRVRYSAFHKNELVSASFDMTIKVWDS